MKHTYECPKCHYKFVPKTARIPDRCPFCDTPGIRPAATAQDIVNDVLNKDF